MAIPPQISPFLEKNQVTNLSLLNWMVTVHYSQWNPCCKGNFNIKWLILIFLPEAISKYNHPARQLGGMGGAKKKFKELSRKSDSMSGFLGLKQSGRKNKQSSPTYKRSVAFICVHV